MAESCIYTVILLKSVCRKLHFAILARSYREISQTVCIDSHSFLSRVRISVRPSYYIQLKLEIPVITEQTIIGRSFQVIMDRWSFVADSSLGVPLVSEARVHSLESAIFYLVK